MRVWVCDDVETIADGWVAAIDKVTPTEFKVARMPAAKDEVSTLLLRKLAVERGDPPLLQASAFDGVDVLVIDYDLLHLDEAGSRTTGEGVARLARTFSTCGAIVVMNQFKGPQFDLGMRGHLGSFADINVDAGLIGCPALWQQVDPAAGQFSPTTWTPVPNLLVAARGLSTELEAKGFDAKLLSVIGLPNSALAELSDTAFGYLSIKAETADELAQVSVSGFLRRSLTDKHVATMSAHAPKILFDFAAFRILKWLDRAVLRPMNILVDGPHLVDRLPFMIDPDKADVSNPGAWAKAVGQPETMLRRDLLGQYYNGCASRALGRPVFDWYRLAGDDEIDKLQDAYLQTEPERFYFAEDTSRFVTRDALTRYRADFHNFGDRRGIERLGNVTYGPMRRVSFG